MRPRACAAIILGNDILMVRHEHGGRTYWTLPGGVEPGETPEEAAVREVREETGLDARVVRFLFEELYGGGASLCHLLEADAGQTALLGHDPEEAHLAADVRMLQEVAWLPLDSVANDRQVSRVLDVLRTVGEVGVSHYWSPGEAVTFHEVLNEKVVCARPVTVVQDTPELTALLLTPGAQCKISTLFLQVMAGNAPRTSRWEEQHSGAWSMGDTVWSRLRVLKLIRPGNYFATWVCWHHETGAFVGWYVNFQLPFVRSALGFDTFDLELDLDVAPDLTWAWKDETEYREGIRWGVISAETADHVESARARVLSLIESRAWPFDGTFIRWEPDGSWEQPRLHTGWDE